MPSGAKKRKAAKKKQVQDLNHSTTTAHSHHGESDGGELSSPASQDPHNNPHQFTEEEAVEVEKREDKSSENKSVVIESSDTAGKDEEGGSIEIDIESKSKKSSFSSSSSSSGSSDDESHVVEKKVVVLESAPVVESVQPVESLTEKTSQSIEELTVETSSIVELVKPVESLVEEASQVYVDRKNGEKKDLVLEEASVVEKPAVHNESGLKDDCATSSVVVESVLKENGVPKLPSLDEKVSLETKDDVGGLTYPKDSVSGVNGADRVNESETRDNPDTQPFVASAPPTVSTTSWKGCCGILELFSGSDR